MWYFLRQRTNNPWKRRTASRTINSAIDLGQAAIEWAVAVEERESAELTAASLSFLTGGGTLNVVLSSSGSFVLWEEKRCQERVVTTTTMLSYSPGEHWPARQEAHYR